MDEKEKTMKAVEEKERKKWERNMGEMGNGCPIVLQGGSENFMCPSFCFRCKSKLLDHKDKGDFLVNGESVEINEPTGAACNYCGPESNNLSQ